MRFVFWILILLLGQWAVTAGAQEVSVASASVVVPSVSAAVFPAKSVSYFYGVVSVSVIASEATDAKVLPSRYALVKRVVDPSSGKITETVTQHSSAPGEPVETTVVELKRVSGTTEFNPTDKKSGFTGSLVFSGDDWNWAGWSYSLQMAEGARLSGESKLTERGISTEKTIVNEASSLVVNIEEDLVSISEERFDEISSVLNRKPFRKVR